MFLPVYQGLKFSYSYEVGIGHYLLFSNDYKTSIYLQGDDARIFKEEIERIDNLPPPRCNDPIVVVNKGFKQMANMPSANQLTENAIDIYL